MSEIICCQSGMSNEYFIKDGKNAIAVDTGAELGEDAVRRHLEEAQLDASDIRLIVITHGHVDHFMNIAALAGVTKAPVACHKNAAVSIRQGLLPEADLEGRTRMGKEILYDQEIHGAPVDSAPSWPVDIEIGDEGEDLSKWGVTARVIYTPGHSRGCISVLAGNEAIVGDLFCAPAQTDHVGVTYFQYKGAAYELPHKSLEKLLEAGAVKFWPGHGKPRGAEDVRHAIADEKNGRELYLPLEEILGR